MLEDILIMIMSLFIGFFAGERCGSLKTYKRLCEYSKKEFEKHHACYKELSAQIHLRDLKRYNKKSIEYIGEQISRN